MEAGRLAIPGAELYYELRGSGPVLLLVNGGAGDAGTFAPLATLLAERYTVITYEPRSRPGGQLVHEHARDAHLLLRALSQEPAYLFGTGYGGTVAMEMLARYPEQVRAAVAHEPLLADPPPGGTAPAREADEGYAPDLEALRGKCTPASGTRTDGTTGDRTARALAERLGVEIAGFPGGRAGFITHPAEFAKTLYEVLDS